MLLLTGHCSLYGINPTTTRKRLGATEPPVGIGKELMLVLLATIHKHGPQLHEADKACSSAEDAFDETEFQLQVVWTPAS